MALDLNLNVSQQLIMAPSGIEAVALGVLLRTVFPVIGVLAVKSALQVLKREVAKLQTAPEPLL